MKTILGSLGFTLVILNVLLILSGLNGTSQNVLVAVGAICLLAAGIMVIA